jgi:DNA-binding NtrC family response regulator
MRLIVCTPDLMFSTRIRSALEHAAHEVRLAESPADVGIAIEEAQPSLAILDIGAFGWNWQPVLREIRETHPDLPVLAFGSHMDVEATRQAMELGATRVVARSEFVNNMVGLVDRYARGSG